MPFKNIELNPVQYNPQFISARSQFYKGFSTVDPANTGSKLYDFDLIKQDILNQFNVRRGERVMLPKYGTIIWDLIMEPLTDQVKQALTDDMNAICNSDPRVSPLQIEINEYDSGFVIEITLMMKNTDQRAVMKLAFDQKLGLLVQ
jgi:phage baseplate assembly protein W